MEYQIEEVSLEITNRCFARCVHCSSDSGEALENELSPAEWIGLIGQASGMAASVVSLSGGDPLAYPDWRFLVWYISHLGMRTLFYTSGVKKDSLIDEKDLKDLSESDDVTLIYSLEGATAEVHNSIVGVDCFNHLVSFAIPRALELGLDVELHFTPMSINCHQVLDFLSLSRDLGIGKVSFLRLVPQGRARQKPELMTSPEQFVQLQHTLYGWKGEPNFRVGCPLSFGHVFGYIEQRPRCHAGTDLLLVRPDGKVHCCAACKNSPALQVGNVREQSLAEIWEKSEMLSTVRLFNEMQAASGSCLGCPFFDRCGGGCPSQRILYNQERGITDPWESMVGGIDPMCPVYTKTAKGWRRRGILKREQDRKGNVSILP